MTEPILRFDDPAVKARFDAFPAPERAGLLTLRQMIFETAAQTPGVGRLLETLKWGQPAYLTPQTKSGSTIRLGAPKEGGIAIYAHCQTSIISDFQSIFPDDFRFEGNRAIHLPNDQVISLEKLRLLVASALTYHLN
ncbi:MAG: DUF1801 domain-containing protein [Rhodobacteraceae bacterium]|nr:DUF1801 domain-containing protein [Paracoccaceae bacterium]